MRFAILIVTLSNTFSVFGQLDWRAKVTVKAENISVPDLLEMLQRNYNLKVSFGFDNIPSNLTISIEAKDITLNELVLQICRKGNLDFRIIDETIVFKYQRPIEKSLRSPSIIKSDVSVDSRDSTASPNVQDAVTEKSDDPKPQIITIDSAALPSDSSSSTLVLSSTPSSTFQTKSPSQVHRLGLLMNYSIDFNEFDFVDPIVPFHAYHSETNWSVGLGYYTFLFRRCSISIGASWVTKSFRLEYNYRVLDPNDPLPIPDKTVVRLHFMEIPILIDQPLVSGKRSSLSVLTGLMTSILLRQTETTSYLNQQSQHTHVFTGSTSSALYGGFIGLGLKGHMNRSVDFFIELSYAYYVNPINEQAMNSGTSLIRIKTGVRYSLARNK